MSVRGFAVNGSTEQYDYDALDNKPTIPTKTSDLANDSGFVNAAGAAAAAPVTSVNGLTGAVTLDAEDVGAMPEPFGTPQHDDIIAYDGVHNRWAVTSLSVWTGGSY